MSANGDVRSPSLDIKSVKSGLNRVNTLAKKEWLGIQSSTCRYCPMFFYLAVIVFSQS